MISGAGPVSRIEFEGAACDEEESGGKTTWRLERGPKGGTAEGIDPGLSQFSSDVDHAGVSGGRSHGTGHKSDGTSDC